MNNGKRLISRASSRLYHGVTSKLGVNGALNAFDDKKFLKSLKRAFSNAVDDFADVLTGDTPKPEKKLMSFNFTKHTKCNTVSGSTVDWPELTPADADAIRAIAKAAGQEENVTYVESLVFERLSSHIDTSHVYQLFNSRDGSKPISLDFQGSTSRKACFEACYYAYEMLSRSTLLDDSDQLCCGHEKLNSGEHGKCLFGFNGRQPTNDNTKSATKRFVEDFEYTEKTLDVGEVCSMENDKCFERCVDGTCTEECFDKSKCLANATDMLPHVCYDNDNACYTKDSSQKAYCDGLSDSLGTCRVCDTTQDHSIEPGIYMIRFDDEKDRYWKMEGDDHGFRSSTEKLDLSEEELSSIGLNFKWALYSHGSSFFVHNLGKEKFLKIQDDGDSKGDGTVKPKLQIDQRYLFSISGKCGKFKMVADGGSAPYIRISSDNNRVKGDSSESNGKSVRFVKLSGFKNDADSCHSHGECGFNQHCENGSCVDRRADRESCNSHSKCLSLRCINGECSSGNDLDKCDNDNDDLCLSGRCESDNRCHAKKAVGGTCNEHSDCISGRCAQGLCTTGGHDETCSDSQPCSDLSATFCSNENTRRCRAKKIGGETCSGNDRCQSNKCAQGLCTDGELNQTCSDSHPCQNPSTTYCNNGNPRRCQARTLDVGESCSGDDRCKSNKCAQGKCTSGGHDETCGNSHPCSDLSTMYCDNTGTRRCQWKKNVGESCSGDDRCKSNKCANGLCTDGELNQTCSDAHLCQNPSTTYCNNGNPRRCQARTLDVGDSCSGDDRCKSNKCAQGKCTSGGHDETCGNSHPCSDLSTMYCDNTGTRRCQWKKNVGESCSGNDRCKSNKCANGLCTDGELNQTCSDSHPCQNPTTTYCNNGNPRRCQARKLDVGESCSGDDRCKSNKCAQGKCTSGGHDETCGNSHPCSDLSTMYCDNTGTRRCQWKKNVGESCSGNDRCKSNKCANGLCTDGELNQTCSDSHLCQNPSTTFCNNGNPRRCQAKKNDGQECSGNDGCKSNKCVQGECTSGDANETCDNSNGCNSSDMYCNNSSTRRCQWKKNVGESCSGNDRCKSNKCANGLCTDGELNQTCSDAHLCQNPSTTYCNNGNPRRCQARTLDVGDSCSGDDRCKSNKCAQGKCTSGGHDETCGNSHPCSDLSTMYCDNTGTRRCQWKKNVGESCSSNDRCKSNKCANGLCTDGELNQTCSDSHPCQNPSTMYCNNGNPRRCQARKLDIGESCSGDDRCKSNKCAQGKCTNGGHDETCSDSHPCSNLSTMFCDNTGTRRCQWKKNVGVSCSGNDRCKSNKCANGLCTDGGLNQTCNSSHPCQNSSTVFCNNGNPRRCQAKKNDREQCSGNDRCKSNKCVQGECTSGDANETCDNSNGCNSSDMYCNNSSTRRCQWKKNVGESCSGNDRCKSNKCVQGECTSGDANETCDNSNGCNSSNMYCNNSSTRRCQWKQNVGESCSGNDRCKSGKCAQGKCTEGNENQTCSDSLHCTKNFYCNNSKTRICRPKVSNGGKCGRNAHCYSNKCKGGKCKS